jgi:hypothetical protein
MQVRGIVHLFIKRELFHFKHNYAVRFLKTVPQLCELCTERGALNSEQYL